MSGNDDNTNPARDEGPANTFETPSPTKAQDHINISSSAGNISPSFRSSSVPAPSSMTQESPQVVCSTPNADTDGQNGHHQPTPVTKVGDSKEPLEDFDWDDLEERFCRKMEECGEVEKELEGEFGEWLEVCSGSRIKLGGRRSRANWLGKGIQGLE